MRVGGHAIDIRGVALDVIEPMGVVEEVRRTKTQLRKLSFVRGVGKPTVDIPIQRALAGQRDLEIVRDDLSRICTRRVGTTPSTSLATRAQRRGEVLGMIFEHRDQIDEVTGQTGRAQISAKRID